MNQKIKSSSSKQELIDSLTKQKAGEKLAAIVKEKGKTHLYELK